MDDRLALAVSQDLAYPRLDGPDLILGRALTAQNAWLAIAVIDEGGDRNELLTAPVVPLENIVRQRTVRHALNVDPVPRRPRRECIKHIIDPGRVILRIGIDCPIGLGATIEPECRHDKQRRTLDARAQTQVDKVVAVIAA